LDDYDDSFWDFDFDGDGDIDAPRAPGSASPGTEIGGAIVIMTLLLLVLALIFCGLL